MKIRVETNRRSKWQAAGTIYADKENDMYLNINKIKPANISVFCVIRVQKDF